MKKTALLILVAAILTIMRIFCFAAAPDSSYIMVLNDEFDGNVLNTDIWRYRLGDVYGGRNLAENVRIADGKLYLDYTKTNNIYSGAGIITKDYLPYGYYETKAKLFTGVNGLHTSFWTDGGILEIDAFEADSNQGSQAPKPYYNLHYWWADHSSTGGKSYDNNTDGNTATSDWFVSGFEWLPGKVVFYSKGEAVGTVYPDVYAPQTLWLTAVAVPDWHKKSDGTYNIDDSKMDANGYFGSSEYEYFRYYNKKLKGVNLLGNGHFELNRTKESPSISCFDVVKKAVSLKSFYTHGGYCYAYLSGTAELGQTLKYLANGQYTFEGYFKTKADTSATIAVYDCDGTLLKSAVIPQCDDWTLVSLKNVSVTNSAYAVVKSTAGTVMADDLSFYCQEGDTTYESYQEDDYNNYNALADNTEYPVLNTALIAQLDSVIYQYQNNPCAFSATNASLVPYKDGNVIYVPYQAIKSDFPIPGVDSQATYVSLNQINASGTYKAHTNGNCILICNASATVNSDVLQAAQISLNNFSDPLKRIESTATYKGTNDVANQTVYDTDSAILSGSWGNSSLGYAANGRYTGNTHGNAVWIPNLPVSNTYSIQIYSNSHAGGTGAGPTTSDAGVDLTIGNQTYAYHLNQYNGSVGWYDLGSFEISGNNLVMVKIYNAAGEGLLRASAIRIIPKGVLKTAEYVGTANETDQIVYDINTCSLSGSWGNSSLGYPGGSRYINDSTATATWTLSAPTNGTYAIQIYSVAHAGDTTMSPQVPPSTTAAGVLLSVSEEMYHYRIDQCTGDTGWYDLGTFALETGQTVDLTLYNTQSNGILRANAVRMIPNTVFETAEYVGTDDKTNQTVYDISTCTLSGTWGNSSLGYPGGSRWTLDPSSTAVWTVSPAQTGDFAIQIYSVAHPGDPISGASPSTTAAGVSLAISGEVHYYSLDQCSGTTGWYDLGTFPLEADQTAVLTLYNAVSSGILRANAVRILPITLQVNGTAMYVGNTTEANQELHPFSEAEKNDSWLGSGGALAGCYYGNGTVTWTVSPQQSKKYSVQLYIPCIENTNTTQEAVVTLHTGAMKYIYTVNQRVNTAANMGWYDLGIFDLSADAPISVKIANNSSLFLRAKDLRLVPLPDSIPATVSSGTVSITPGFIKNYIGKILFAEYNDSGALQNVQILEPSDSISITMQNALNQFKIFYWEDMVSIKPFMKPTESE